MTPAFLIADDDTDQRELLTRILKDAFPGCAVTALSDPTRVVELASGVKPNVIFLDWVFPRGRTGPQVCLQLKALAATRSIPVILMSGQRTDLASRFKTVRCGADLFIEKPYLEEAVVGYARALLEKSGRDSSSSLRLGALSLDREQGAAWVGKDRVPALPPRLFELLWLLARRSPKAVEAPDLVRFAYGDAVRDRYITVAITRLRQRLKAFSQVRIEASPGHGYRLVVD